METEKDTCVVSEIIEIQKITYEKFSAQDYNEVFEFWSNTEGVGIGAGDNESELAYFLELNDGLCFIAKYNGQIIGTILCGQDGRRGYLYHAAVKKEFRCKGIAKSLTDLALKRLKDTGIGKCHLFVFKNNISARSFWSHMGWKERTDLVIMSKNIYAY